MGVGRFLAAAIFSIAEANTTPLRTVGRERAALAWAEAVTSLKGGEVSDDVYELAKKHFSEEELVDLTLAAATTGTWNRVNIAFRTTAGTYQPGQWSAAAK